MNSDINIDFDSEKTEELFDILENSSFSDEVFSGYNQKSRSKGIQNRVGAYTTRYLTHFDGAFQFFGDFIDKLDTVINDETELYTGYVYPDKEDIDLFVKVNKKGKQKGQIRRSIINQTEEIVKDWMDNNINDVLEDKNTTKYRVKYLTSKVGSGKSTFLDHLYQTYYKKYLEEGVYIVRVRFYDFDMSYRTPKTIRKHITNLIINKCIDQFIKLSPLMESGKLVHDFIENLALDEKGQSRVQTILNNKIDKAPEKAEKLKNIKCYTSADDETCLEMFFKHICRYSEKKAKFFVFIDGFDELNPEIVHKYDQFIKVLKDIMYNDLYLERIYYLLTLRTCTYVKFTKSDSNVKYLVPPNEFKIIHHAIRYVANHNRFVKLHESFFIDFFNIIYRKIGEVLNIKNHRMGLIEVFDYNHRFLLRYTRQIICFTFDRYTTEHRKLESFSDFVDILKRDNFKEFECFLDQKWYILLDILMLKNHDTYYHPYSIRTVDKKKKQYTLRNTLSRGTKKQNKDILSFIDDVYNYVIKYDMVAPRTVFPLLIKLRILQLFYIKNAYCDSHLIYKELIKIGYNTQYFNSIISDLHAAKFLKVTCKDFSNNICDKQYKITNRGILVINELSLQTIYINHVIPLLLLPHKNNSIMHFSPYLYKDHETQLADLSLINNYVCFINVVRKIEDKEKSITDNSDLFKKVCISEKIHHTFINNLKRLLIAKKHREGDAYETNIEEIVEHIKKLPITTELAHAV